jgi:hypothetical protein
VLLQNLCFTNLPCFLAVQTTALEKKGKLTWSSQMVYSYAEPGNYTIWVEAFTGVGSVFRTVMLPVYGMFVSTFTLCLSLAV